jgi:ribose/xylose/arabinose/galactoside ABC-type transport system permease subunit
MYSSRLGNPSPQLDQGLLFSVIVAIVIGGTSLHGGEGSVLGTFVGAILIGTVNNGLNLLGISTFYYYISLGILLVASVGLDTALRRDAFHRLRRRLQRAGPTAGASP